MLSPTPSRFLKVWGLVTEWLLFEFCSEVLPCQKFSHGQREFALCHNFSFLTKTDCNSVNFPSICSFSAHHLLAHNATYTTPTQHPRPPFWFNTRTAQRAPPPPTSPAPPPRRVIQSSLRREGGAWPTAATNRHPRCGGAAANRLFASSGVRCPCALLCWHGLVAVAAAWGAAVAPAAWPRSCSIFTEDEPLRCPARVPPCPSEPIHLATGEGRAATCWCVRREPGWGEGGGAAQPCRAMAQGVEHGVTCRQPRALAAAPGFPSWRFLCRLLAASPPCDGAGSGSSSEQQHRAAGIASLAREDISVPPC